MEIVLNQKGKGVDVIVEVVNPVTGETNHEFICATKYFLSETGVLLVYDKRLPIIYAAGVWLSVAPAVINEHQNG